MPDEKRGGVAKTGGYAARLEKYQQLSHRHAPSFIRHVLDAFRQHTLTANQAAEQLGLSPSRLYALATAYNTARARQPQWLWTPGTSGGDHATAWPQPVLDLLQKRLACSPPCPYSFAASEALRLARLQTRPRPGPPLGARKPARPCPPAPKNPGRRPPLATRSNRRILAARRLAAPVVSSLPDRLPHAQSAR